jgi:hypothetical protein
VLGENNLAYASYDNGILTGNSAPKMIEFDTISGGIPWTTNTSQLESVAVATADGVATISGGLVNTYGQGGSLTSYNLGLQNPIYREGGTWNGVSASFSPMAVQAAQLDAALSPAPYFPFLSRGSANAGRVSVLLTLHSSGCSPSPCTVSSDDAALSSYQNAEGTTNLGAIVGTGYQVGCFVGSEMVGKITPRNYTGSLTLHRLLINEADYKNTLAYSTSFNVDDTSRTPFRDDDPQSGGSAGKIYDLDAPGPADLPVDGNIYRSRFNFYAHAALSGGTRVSTFYKYNVRMSCQGTASGPQFVNDVPGDNQVVVGFTPITWDLNP